MEIFVLCLETCNLFGEKHHGNKKFYVIVAREIIRFYFHLVFLPRRKFSSDNNAEVMTRMLNLESCIKGFLEIQHDIT